MADSSAELDKASEDLLATLNKVALPITMPTHDKSYRLSLRELTLATFSAFGGAEGLSILLRQSFNESTPGSQAQASILNMILRGLEKFGEEEKEVDEETIESLEKALRKEFLKELMDMLSESTRKLVLQEVS